MPKEKLTWDLSLDDFVEFIRCVEENYCPIHRKTGEPATREQIAGIFETMFNVNYGKYGDFKTLDLCSNGSNLSEEIMKSIEKFRRGEVHPSFWEQLCEAFNKED